MAENARFSVEVAYALPGEQTLLTLEIEAETTVEQAIKASGILEKYPQIDLATDKVGIFGKVCKLDATLRGGDRIEIYRPLQIDPKELRRQMADLQRRQQQQ